MHSPQVKRNRKTNWCCATLLLAVAIIIVLTAPVLAKETQPSSTKKIAKNETLTENVRRERDNTEKEIAGSRVRLTFNDQKISDQLDRLNDIESQIVRQEGAIDEINLSIEEMTQRSAILADSIRMLQQEDSILCLQVAQGLRERHVQSQRMPKLAFLSSSKNLRQAQIRLNYLNVIQRAKNTRVKQLRAKRDELIATKAELEKLKKKRSAAVLQLTTAKDILKTRQNEAREIIHDLKNQEAEIEKVLLIQKQYLDQLNVDLSNLIYRQQREFLSAFKTEKRQDPVPTEKIPDLKGTFQSNKGKLLFPVPGRYTIVGTFGRSRHSELSHVQLDNSGIDISVKPGTRARAVFDGEVSSIVFMENYENVILIRHGKYLTVYAGLGTISVKKGDKVRTGQDLGKIASVSGRTILHFEVRNETDKLNPLLWVR